MNKITIFILLTIIFFFLFANCSPYLSISHENSDDLAQRSEIVIITTSGEKITTSNYWISADTLFISEPRQLIYKGRQDTLLFEEIEQIRDYKNAELTPVTKAVVDITGVMLVLFFGFSLFILYQLVTGDV